jgi:small-conductance mechanosensitive channel
MDFKSLLDSVKRALDSKLFTLGDTTVTLGTVATIVFIVVVTYLISRSVQRGLGRLLSRGGMREEAKVRTAQRLAHYLILLGGLVAALQTVGIDLSTLFAAGAVFAVGLGFALQNVVQNFVSGVILLVERSIKTGDVLKVEDRVVRVERIGIRSTVVRTRTEEDLIIPNSVLVQGTVTNYTLNNESHLIVTRVGVIYGSEMKRVAEVLQVTAESLPWRDRALPIRILLSEFGNSSVDFDVYVGISDPWRGLTRRSELNEALWKALKEAGITIAFPQLDLHLDPPVAESLRLMTGGAASG